MGFFSKRSIRYWIVSRRDAAVRSEVSCICIRVCMCKCVCVYMYACAYIYICVYLYVVGFLTYQVSFAEDVDLFGDEPYLFRKRTLYLADCRDPKLA